LYFFDNIAVPEIHHDEVFSAVSQNNSLLLDVRTKGEIAEGIIPTAKALPGMSNTLFRLLVFLISPSLIPSI